MSRPLRKALLLFCFYASILAAVVVAGFLGKTVGVWAAILWGIGIIIGLALVARQRFQGRTRA
jgi:fucose permease